MNANRSLANKVMAAIREILISEWDPIGVMNDPDWPRDEYDAYVGQVYRLLEQGDSAESIARYLCFVEETRMGLGVVESEERINVAIKLKAVGIRFDNAGGSH